MIRWTFYFDEGSVSSEVTNDEEDQRIGDIVNGADGISGISWLSLPGEQFDMQVNLCKVKCVIREKDVKPTPFPENFKKNEEISQELKV